MTPPTISAPITTRPHPMLFAARRRAWLERQGTEPDPAHRALEDTAWWWRRGGPWPQVLELDMTVDTWGLEVDPAGRCWPVPFLDRGQAWSPTGPTRGRDVRPPKGTKIEGWLLDDRGTCRAVLLGAVEGA